MSKRTIIFIVLYVCLVLIIGISLISKVPSTQLSVEEELILRLEDACNIRVEYWNGGEKGIVEPYRSSKYTKPFVCFVEDWVLSKDKIISDEWIYRVTFNFRSPDNYSDFEPLVFLVYEDGIQFDGQFYIMKNSNYSELFDEIDNVFRGVIQDYYG